MKRLLLSLAIALFASSALPAYASQASDSLLNADRALAALSHKIGFVKAYSQAIGDNPRKLDAGSPTAMGRVQALAMIAGYGADTQVDWRPVEAFVSNDGTMGYTWGHFIARFHDKHGKLVSSRGRYLDVWRRGADGKWRWIADIGTDDPTSAH
jgi:hypothetical protein